MPFATNLNEFDKKLKYGIIASKEISMSNKIYYFIIPIVFAIFFMGCATTSAPMNLTPTTDRWAQFELMPSRVINTIHGETIMTTTLHGGSTLIVFRDNNIPSVDRQFVYSRINHDFGWRSSGDYWVRANPNITPRRTVAGYMYVNPSRRMAIYFFPDRTWGVYGVRIE